MCRLTTSVTSNTSPNQKPRLSSTTSRHIQEHRTKDDVDEEWIGQLDIVAFAADIRALGKTLENQQGEADVRHLNKLLMWINSVGIIGFLTMGFCVNPVSIVCLSTFVFCRWTMVAHHTCHGGYDKCLGGRWHRFRFALGSLWRRWCDWFDWMMPEAWNIEHNNLHHYHLSEPSDPDVVELNNSELRSMQVPLFVKYMVVALVSVTWKWLYYAPNTYKELKLAQLRKQGRDLPPGVDPKSAVTFFTIARGKNPFFSVWELFSAVMGPYLIIHFFLTPLPYLLLEYAVFGAPTGSYYWNAVKNLFWAELLTNLHATFAVLPNHAGDDMYRFQHPCRPFSGSFYVRQVIASVDFAYGNDLVDTLHGFLNYQIEHHLWPNLSMLSYQKAAPQVRAICKKHGVPYIQESILKRAIQTANIMVGASSMRTFPQEYEQLFLKRDAEVELEKKHLNQANKRN
uniref:Fatty acid desaturase domain-containing protein n=1 Tax=Cyclophora tenuis TaxID=216820 RepID=A0A7S1CWN4_CYCTE|mmetsp:Transcript_12478/g.21158  ORF Transcript_12478/g.21158 Transcript_12478/m.21158 type:complete len:455 (+) Transcript_12478:82-1446(+)|eukprot:CAMPEP_0116568026 /NCGR_PEP_ID=MMETSP0397-20121206/15373_1 /TAXON_ID=216820 /ORGANISM="Cyclophora tenuis, Strain ECT3854" /LENGTH=454 /DNA_ID=CAMNT_0004095161 /DNA_START=1 /DNA_END=1365 /DNA_ORIENTATION=-